MRFVGVVVRAVEVATTTRGMRYRCLPFRFEDPPPSLLGLCARASSYVAASMIVCAMLVASCPRAGSTSFVRSSRAMSRATSLRPRRHASPPAVFADASATRASSSECAFLMSSTLGMLGLQSGEVIYDFHAAGSSSWSTPSYRCP